MLLNEKEITGTEINFYFHCKRQLWFFSHHINTEHESDEVQMGRLIHESSYDRERKEIEIGSLKIDFLDIRDGVLHEVKKSDSWHEAHEWQLLYYLYRLKQRGISNFRGELNYPVIRRTIKIELTPDKENRLKEIVAEIKKVITLAHPPNMAANRNACRKCSYYELCWVE